MKRHPRRAPALAAILLLGAARVAPPASPGAGPEGTGAALAGAVDSAIDRGVRYLLLRQNPDGSWGSARRTKGLNIYAPVPGAHHAFRAAVTALCVSALLEVARDRPDVPETVVRAEKWLAEHLPRLRRATPDAIYNVWGHAYAIRALVSLLGFSPPQAPAGREARLKELIQQQVALLLRYESVDGGWGYYDFRVGTRRPAASPTSFTTATVLLAFHEAQEAGVTVPGGVVDRAVRSILRQQKPDFSYVYGEYLRWQPMRDVNRRAGSLGRSQACNLALRLWGDRRITDEVLAMCLRRLFERNLWLDMGRKRPVPHESWFEVAGYFFYYGHYYAALCLEELPPARRVPFQRQLARILLGHQEPDGSWWDYPFYDYHWQYGTAYALMALGRCYPRAAASF